MASQGGYFAPESVIRRLGNSPLIPLFGGGPAVLLQVAHPLVAAGVVEHSDYRNNFWRRLLRTLRALYLIVYGSKQEAERAGEAVAAVHAHVRGMRLFGLGHRKTQDQGRIESRLAFRDRGPQVLRERPQFGMSQVD
jgi:uncharacterized protein (DUF2236 family)